MADTKTVKKDTSIASLFEKATTNLDSVSNVSQYIKTGRRWDLKHSDVFGDVMVIRRIKEINTKFGPAYLASVDHKGEQKDVLMGGQVLIDQLRDLEPNLPVVTVVRKPGRSYVLTDATPLELEAYKTSYID